MQEVICLIAPTASGKTALAYELYDTGKYYLISVDSALIYRDMNIGTAKPSNEELLRYPHALVDIINPDQSYSVAQFVTDVKFHIDIAKDQGKTPILVGGTMMYYMALLEGIADIPATLPEIRHQVMSMINEQGIDKVHDYLKYIDPILGKRLKQNDTQRIGRAVEVYLQTGKPLSKWQQTQNYALAQQSDQSWKLLVVMPDRAWLHQRIALRLEIMWQQGLVEEVIALQQHYQLNKDMPSMRCVGYRQVWEFLEKINKDKHDTIEKINKINKHFTTDSLPKLNSLQAQSSRQIMENQALYATRQLAKRQYTWMRKLITTQQLIERFEIQQLTTVEQAKHLLISKY